MKLISNMKQCLECGKMYIEFPCDCGGTIIDIAATQREYNKVLSNENHIKKVLEMQEKFQSKEKGEMSNEN